MAVKIVEDYTIKKTLLGGFQVRYNCPYCESQLRSTESEIREQDWCPECRQPFRVSAKALSEIESRREAVALKKEQKANEKRQRREQRNQQTAERDRQEQQPTPNQAPPSQVLPKHEHDAPKLIPKSKPVPQDGNSQSTEKKCPFCAEMIKSTAIKCHYCKQFIDGRPDQPKMPPSSPRPNRTKPETSGLQLFGWAITSVAGITLVAVFGGMLLIGACCLGIFGSSLDTIQTNRPSVPRNASVPTRQWYEGGTLHNQSALGWQTASRQDKLATCGDFVATMWEKGSFVDEIQGSIKNVDDMKPYAEELVEFVDAATEQAPDADTNRRIFANQKVSDLAVLGMVTMNWTK